MTYAIWIVSLLVGVGLAMQDAPVNAIGWLVIVAGALVGYRVGKAKDRERQAEAITRAMQPPPES